MNFLKRKKILVTHSGSFHADDIFACATLALYCDQQKQNYTIVRTRDESLIEKGDYVFDVGGVYDPEINRFDHHQPQGAGVRDNTIPFAAFGLVWQKFGPLICKDIEIVHDLDRRIVQPIDAIDNGISITESIECGLYDYGIHRIVSAYQQKQNDVPDESKQLKNFIFLVDFCKDLLKREIDHAYDRFSALDIIEKAYDRASNKEIVEIDARVNRSTIMQALDKYKDVLYVVYQGSSYWNVFALRKEQCGFDSRKPLPKAWAGKRDEELQNLSGVPDAVFCHNALFLAVAKSKEGALALAKYARDHVE